MLIKICKCGHMEMSHVYRCFVCGCPCKTFEEVNPTTKKTECRTERGRVSGIISDGVICFAVTPHK
jgi:hypothetical protein